MNRQTRTKIEKARLSKLFKSFGNFCPICGEIIEINERYCKNCQEISK